jgi:hypothetical protein
MEKEEIEIIGWMHKKGYDRKASQEIAQIIVQYLKSEVPSVPESVSDEEIEKQAREIYPINIKKVCGVEYDYNTLERNIWITGFKACQSNDNRFRNGN